MSTFCWSITLIPVCLCLLSADLSLWFQCVYSVALVWAIFWNYKDVAQFLRLLHYRCLVAELLSCCVFYQMHAIKIKGSDIFYIYICLSADVFCSVSQNVPFLTSVLCRMLENDSSFHNLHMLFISPVGNVSFPTMSIDCLHQCWWILPLISSRKNWKRMENLTIEHPGL